MYEVHIVHDENEKQIKHNKAWQSQCLCVSQKLQKH